MIIEIPNLTSDEEVVRLKELFDQAPKQDGKKSAGPTAVTVKSNVELIVGSPEFEEMRRILDNALGRNHPLEIAIMPVQSTQPIFGCYTSGMSYGEHLDNATTFFKPSPVSAVFGGRFRADVSATLFISNTDEYEGGELMINSPAGMRAVKCAAGNMIIYPSGYLHSVAEVTSGLRRVAAIWFQSYVRNPEHRDMLYKLVHSSSNLMAKVPGDPDVKMMNFVYNNLVRMWGDSG